MAAYDFPTEGLVPNVTTHTIGERTWIWTGIGWEISSPVPTSAFALESEVIKKTTNTGSAKIPAGPSSERDGSPEFAYFRGNTELTRMEWWNGTDWAPMGGATGGGNDQVFYLSDRYVRYSYAIPENTNSFTSGTLIIGKELNITSISGDGTTLTVDVDEPHLCSVGDIFEIAGTTSFDAEEYIVASVPSATRVTALSAISAATETTGSFEKNVVIDVSAAGAVWTHV